MAMDSHVRVAAWLRILWSGVGLIPALIFLLFYGGISIVVGVVTGAVIAVPLLMVIGAFIATLIAITALPGLITGWGLLSYQPWARILNIVLSALDLFNFPLGTALGVYSLWVMLNPETVELFEGGQPIGRYPSHF
jgi:hypothetical protein